MGTSTHIQTQRRALISTYVSTYAHTQTHTQTHTHTDTRTRTHIHVRNLVLINSRARTPPSHTYDDARKYTVTITGKLVGFRCTHAGTWTQYHAQSISLSPSFSLQIFGMQFLLLALLRERWSASSAHAQAKGQSHTQCPSSLHVLHCMWS
jgi:hypothetical protein